MSDSSNIAESFAKRHFQFAWWSLLCFLSLGIFLETLHGFKVSWYLDSSFETRRLMWTLGHAHGTLLSLVHGLFAASITAFPKGSVRHYRIASGCLMAASILLPGGFFMGGIVFYDGDPGMGIFLVPVGAVLLFVGVLVMAIAMGALGTSPGGDDSNIPKHKPRVRKR